MHAAQTYADFGNDSEFLAGPERTSIMAIIALVLGIIAIPTGCIGVGAIVGAIAIVLAILALVLIGGSGGRTGGKGIAIAAIITGLIGAVLGAVVLFSAIGAFKAVEEVVQNANQKLIDFDAGDNEALDPIFMTSAGITEAQYAAFRDAYKAEYGDFVGLPIGSFADLRAGYENVAVAFQNNPDLQSWNGDRIPIAAEFSNGWALAVLYLDQNAQGEAPFTNIVLIGADGTGEISLADMPGGGEAAPAAVDTDAPASTEVEEAEAEDEPDAEPSDG